MLLLKRKGEAENVTQPFKVKESALSILFSNITFILHADSNSRLVHQIPIA